MSSLLFPGQGSQIVGMGSEFFNNFQLVKKIFKEADEKLNFSISKLILEGPSDQLQLTKNTQPAILTVSYSIYETLKKEFNFDFSSFKFFAGHSLGEYSALVCSGSLKFEDALYLLHQRGTAMQEAVPVGQGSMAAILGTKIDLIKEIISAPFHCTLMKPAAEYMTNKIKNIEFKIPKHNIISNVTADTITDPEIIKKLLIKQIYSSVKWRESILRMSKEKVRNFIEIGPGKVLTGMVKRTIKGANCFSINSIADIKNLINEFKK